MQTIFKALSHNFVQLEVLNICIYCNCYRLHNDVRDQEYKNHIFNHTNKIPYMVANISNVKKLETFEGSLF